MRGFVTPRPWRLLADASGSKRRAWSATERGGLPGGRARSAPAPRGAGAPRFRRWGRSSRSLVRYVRDRLFANPVKLYCVIRKRLPQYAIGQYAAYGVTYSSLNTRLCVAVGCLVRFGTILVRCSPGLSGLRVPLSFAAGIR